jgi:hypothetical protein
VVPRIGEILLRAGLATEADIEEALEVARARRMRLASALITLGRVWPDDAARALAEQAGVPAALEKHLQGRDVTLAELLPPQYAWSMGALPIATSRGRDAIVVCTRDPVPSAVTTLERVIGRPVVLAVAAEVVLLPLIAEAYPVGLQPDAVPMEVEVDVDLESGPIELAHVAEPEPALDPAKLELVSLDDRSVTKDPTQVVERLPGAMSSPAIPLSIGGRDRLRRTTGAQAVHASALGEIELPAAPLRDRPHGTPLDPTLVALAAAETRDVVVTALEKYLRHAFDAGVVFVLKDGLALGQAGFGPNVVDSAVEALALPLSSPSVLRLAQERAATFAGPPPNGSLVQERFFKLFGGEPPHVAVVPIVIRGRVINLLYAHGPRRGGIEDAAQELTTVAEAAAEAFVRIIREQKESRP